MGFMAIERTVGRVPRQRVRPALPVTSFMWSGLETAPTVAMHSWRTRRVAPDELRIGPCGTRNLATAARLEFDIVHNGTDRHGGQLHGVAGLHVGLDAGDHRVARRQ